MESHNPSLGLRNNWRERCLELKSIVWKVMPLVGNGALPTHDDQVGGSQKIKTLTSLFSCTLISCQCLQMTKASEKPECKYSHFLRQSRMESRSCMGYGRFQHTLWNGLLLNRVFFLDLSFSDKEGGILYSPCMASIR